MTKQFKLVKRVAMLLLLCLFLMPQQAEAQRKKKKRKKDDKTEAAAPVPKKPKVKSISDLVKKSKKIEGLFTIYQDTVTGSLQMVVSEDQLGKEFIHFSQIANGVTDAGAFRGSYRGSKVFKIKKYFDKLEFATQNTSYYFDPSNAISRSKDANISEGIMATAKIEAHDKETGLYLIKADGIFLKETLSQIKPPRFPGQSPFAFSLGNLDKMKTKVNAIKNYPENTDMAVDYVYSKSSVLNGGSAAVTDGRNVSVTVHHSLIAMPNNDYQTRLDDPRVGYFLTQVTDQTDTGSIPYRDLVHRWHLKKKDPNAAISEPVEPIVWWMENSTPVEWRETITKGVLEWNKAFEKAGFKNAMVVKMQPDDADWDAGDIRYNVLRWTSSPNPPFGGYGPSFVNPRTGQILGADIMLEYVHFTNRVMYDKLFDLTTETKAFDPNDYMKDDKLFCSLGHVMHENTMFGQAVLAAANADDLEMERMKKEAMIALIMHEVGHTLGLNHNMKASHTLSPEELSNPEFIKGKCLTGSVMDYAGINLTKDKSKQGQFYDTSVGPYDVWAIQFGYTPFKNDAERNTLLNQSTKPELIFGNDADDMRAPGKAIDPRVMIGDLSNDQIGYSIDRIELVNDLMQNVKSKFVKDGQSYQELRRAYYILSGQRNIATGVISRFIGGVYVDRAMAGQQGATQPYTPVSLEDQKRAMNALAKYTFAPDAYNAPNDLYNYLALQRRGYNFFGGPEDPKIHAQVLSYQRNVLAHILHPNTLQRISDSELYGNKYSISMFLTDLNNAIFKADIYGNVNSFRQNLQLEYVNGLIAGLTGRQSSRYTHAAKSMMLYNLKTIRAMAAPSGNIASKAHKQHLRTRIDNALKEIK
ncbi:zinc-dependent metalloprotease [Ichthyenterobacterium sp. W332]|uniref:Zinc-dependent metalloprotease n=1 Tax=Microcosmobacter mediterraneus TaxID=3075607 RepID=A0ABU2YL31_9FLAO|nr:zinc-dependent metalloprotease [Ichthyenterobacterium sp. W332]MDT0558876.1 zinc-dependent metalloprotease [Ichthyenterobacterium sp. W332]